MNDARGVGLDVRRQLEIIGDRALLHDRWSCTPLASAATYWPSVCADDVWAACVSPAGGVLGG